MADKKFNIGIIGAGMIGDVHLENILRDGRGEVTWIATRTEKTLNKKLQKYNIANGTTDYRELLQDDDLDAVIIAAPPFVHLAMFEAALKAGKHIVIEKPLAANRADMEQMVKIAAQYPDLMILECSCRHARLQPKFDFVKKIIDSGKIGEVYHIHHNAVSRGTFIEWNPAGTWAHQHEKAGGGAFVDWGVYDLSFHLGLLNDKAELQSLESFTKNGLKPLPENLESDIEEHGAAYMKFDTGLTYYFERGAGVQFEVPNETRIYGTKGGLRFGFCSWDPAEVELFYVDDAGNEKQETLKVDVPDSHDDNFAFTEHFLDCLDGKAKPGMSIQRAAKHLDIIFKILGK
ncbi:MAG: Gfo/Idh/MocA family protein [Fidelibacterota bacterium]